MIALFMFVATLEFFFTFAPYYSLGLKNNNAAARHGLYLIVRMKNYFTGVPLFLLCILSSSAFSQQPAASPEQYLDDLLNTTYIFDTTRLTPLTVIAGHTDQWKKWRTVNNFYFGKNRGALPMIADLEALHPFFRDKVIELIRVCKAAGITLEVVETFRTASKQAEYFAMGNKYTRTPGGKSRHQYGLAVDLVPVVDSSAVWDNQKLWRKIGIAGERLGLLWGGRWKVLYDPGHFEWIGGISRYSLTKGLFPAIPSSARNKYPDIEEDIKRLQDFWEAWEAEQGVVASNRF